MTAAAQRARQRSRPGRHRSEAADEAIMAATLELLGEHGYGGVTMAGVIERAGVSSATLYRRFSNKDDLVAAAVATLVPSALEIDTGSLAGDLKAFVAALSRALVNRRAEVTDALGQRVEAQRAAACVAAHQVPGTASSRPCTPSSRTHRNGASSTRCRRTTSCSA